MWESVWGECGVCWERFGGVRKDVGVYGEVKKYGEVYEEI